MNWRCWTASFLLGQCCGLVLAYAGSKNSAGAEPLWAVLPPDDVTLPCPSEDLSWCVHAMLGESGGA